MSLEMMASGNLVVDPMTKVDRSQTFVTFTISCQVHTNEGGEPVWIDVNVTGQLMQRAERLKKGDGVWVRGHVSLRRYVTPKGHEREAWQMAANELITHRETYEA